jgi:hypothetical protein
MGFLRSVVLGLALALPLPLMAAPVSPENALDLEVTATGGGYLDGQTASGAVFWTGSLLSGVGYESLSRSGAFGSRVDAVAGLFFDVGAPPIYTFTEADDDLGPILIFLDGVLQTIDYVVTDGISAFDLAAYGVSAFSFETRAPVVIDGTTVRVDAIVKYLEDPSPVPLPAGLPLLAGGLGLLALSRRRRQA